MNLNSSGTEPVSAVMLPARPPSTAVAVMRTEVLSHRVGAGGLCSDSADDRWYPAGSSFGSRAAYVAYARAACLGCTVRDECLELALRIEARVPGGPHGIWGGTVPAERREMIRRRQEGGAK